MLVVVSLIKPFPIALCTISWAGVTANRGVTWELDSGTYFRGASYAPVLRKNDLIIAVPRRQVPAEYWEVYCHTPQLEGPKGGSQKNPCDFCAMCRWDAELVSPAQPAWALSDMQLESCQGIKEKEKSSTAFCQLVDTPAQWSTATEKGSKCAGRNFHRRCLVHSSRPCCEPAMLYFPPSWWASLMEGKHGLL